jgi:translocation and assembly module TamA
MAAAELEVSGVSEALETNIRIMSPLSTTPCDSARWRVERLYRDSDTDVREALRALGYYTPVIEKSLAWRDECWHVQLQVDPGEPVRLTKVDIRIDGPASTDTDFAQRLGNDRPQAGRVFHHGQYEDFKSALVRAATYAGYFDADFTRARVVVDPASQSADLALFFETGPKYRFGDVTFTEGILRDSLLAGYSDIRPGEPYSSRQITELYQALNGSTFFESVRIVTEPVDTDAKTVPVHVRLTPAKRKIFSAGGGFTTDLGPHIRFGFANRRINNRGHQFDSRLYLSPVDSELNTAYRWPRRDPRSDWLSVIAGAQHLETDTSEHDKLTLGVLRTRSLGRSWLETRYVNVEWENYVVANQDTSSQLVILGNNWEKAVGRALSRADNGYRVNFDVRGASDSLGSDTSFLQFRSRLRWIHSFTDRARVLGRANIGATAKESLDELPASVRFFSGGDRSVRGYEFQSIGPVNDDGEVIGGSHQVDLSLEFDYLVAERWAVAGFVDSGSAFDEGNIDLHTGVGLGVRWYSPLGPVRLDFAHPLDDPDKSLRVHISLGPDL